MNIWIIIAFAAILLVLLFSLFHKSRDVAVGICATTLDQTVRKNANKEKALTFLTEHGEARNEEIRVALGVSRTSVVRYMDELEREGRVEQVGDADRGVSYRTT